ncbi:MAG: Na+/H+ antiporter subunit E [Balneolales bacterium]
MKQLSLLNISLSFISLMTFWLIMSGMFQLPQIIQGIISVVIVLAVNHSLKRYKFFENEMDDLGTLRFYYASIYPFWMMKEIVKSGFYVARVILFTSKPIQTYIIKFRCKLPSAHAMMILGNSITLTPGTLTIDIEGDEFTVHALTQDTFAGIVSDEMPRKVLQLFEAEDRPVIHDVRILNKAEETKAK